MVDGSIFGINFPIKVEKELHATKPMSAVVLSVFWTCKYRSGQIDKGKEGNAAAFGVEWSSRSYGLESRYGMRASSARRSTVADTKHLWLHRVGRDLGFVNMEEETFDGRQCFAIRGNTRHRKGHQMRQTCDIRRKWQNHRWETSDKMCCGCYERCCEINIL